MPSGRVTISNNTVQSGDSQGVFGMYLAQTGGKGSYNVKNNLISNFKNDDIIPPGVPSGTAIAILGSEPEQGKRLCLRKPNLRVYRTRH